MTKRIITALLLVCICALLAAGDAAAFVDMGFSKDGRVYMFAQHGTVDKTWRGFAEIYSVDIAKNVYIKSGCFSIPSSAATEGINGSVLYERLFEKNAAYIKNQSLMPANLAQTLYIKSGQKTSVEQIVFTDFEGSTQESPVWFYVNLVPWYGGKTASSKSSFFINVERKDKDGNVLSKQTAGNPDIKRVGISEYTIEKIMRSSDGKKLIFVVEKKMPDVSGLSIRYMVETLILK